MPVFGDADASSPSLASVNTNWTTVGATSGLFTPPSGSLVVLFVYADTSSGANPGNETVTDTIDGATGWTFRIRRAKPDSGSQAGTVAWWEKVYASAPVAPIAVTVVGNATGGTSGGFKAHVVAGCSSSEGHAEGSNTAAAVSLAITSTTDNARGIVAATDWNVQANMTAGTAQTALLASSVGSGPDTRVYLGIRDAVTSPAGAVTMSTASPTSGNANNFVGGFLVPAAGGTSASVTLGAPVAAIAAVPSPTISTGSVVTLAGAVAAIAAVPAPTVALSVAIAPASVAAIAAVPSPTKSTGSTVALTSAVAAIAAVPAPVLSTGSVVTLGGAVTAIAAVPSPSITAGGNATAAPVTVTAITAMPTPTISTGSRVTLGGPVAAVAVVPSPVVSIAAVITLAGPVAAVAGVFGHLGIVTGSVVTLGAALAVTANVHTPVVSTDVPGLAGEAHGPLPVAPGAITVHTVSIAGAVT